MDSKINKYSEIEELVTYALGANSKAQAERYLKRLEFMSNSGEFYGYTAIVFTSLIASTRNASGNVNDKERKQMFAHQDLYKLQGLMNNDNGGKIND